MSLLWVVVIMCRWIRSLIEIQSKYNSYFTNNEYVSMLENHASRWTSELPITNKQLDLYIKFIYIYISLNLNPKINTILKINLKISSNEISCSCVNLNWNINLKCEQKIK